MSNRIDRAWFKAQTGRIGYTQNEVARALGIDRGAWSKTLAGSRKMKDDERVKVASLFGVPLEDVLERTGLVTRTKHARAQVREVGQLYPASGVWGLSGQVDAVTGAAMFSGKDTPPGDVLLGIVGDTFLDGWAVVCRPEDVATVPDSQTDTAIVKLPDGRLLLRKVRAGFTAGRFDLGPVFGFGGQENNVEIEGVIPVVGLRRI